MVITVGREGEPAQRHTLQLDRIDVGRDASCDLVLSGEQVSGRHARLFVRAGQLIVRDLGSTNGTLLNGRAITRPALFGPADVLRVGPYILRLEAC